MTAMLEGSALVDYLLEEGSEELADNLSVGFESVELMLVESYNAILTPMCDKYISPANAFTLTKAWVNNWRSV
ncbi:MAG: hypothetical protein KIY11_09585 [Thermoplasmata archaeon]|nr:hypothetical protein [Candidatus Sysuiplasma acidicola]